MDRKSYSVLQLGHSGCSIFETSDTDVNYVGHISYRDIFSSAPAIPTPNSLTNNFLLELDNAIFNALLALHRRPEDPLLKSILRHSKLLSQQGPGLSITVQGTQYSPYEVLFLILKSAQTKAESRGTPIKKAIVTSAFHFNSEQQRVVKQACAAVGIKARFILNQDIVLSYIDQENNELGTSRHLLLHVNRRIMSLSLIESSETMSTSLDIQFKGVELFHELYQVFSEPLVNYCINKLYRDYDVDIQIYAKSDDSQPWKERVLAEIQFQCYEAVTNFHLSSSPSYSVTLKIDSERYSYNNNNGVNPNRKRNSKNKASRSKSVKAIKIEITRKDFEQFNRHNFENLNSSVRRLIGDSGDQDDLKVLLVQCPTSSPLVEGLTRTFSRNIHHVEPNPRDSAGAIARLYSLKRRKLVAVNYANDDKPSDTEESPDLKKLFLTNNVLLNYAIMTYKSMMTEAVNSESLIQLKSMHDRTLEDIVNLVEAKFEIQLQKLQFKAIEEAVHKLYVSYEEVILNRKSDDSKPDITNNEDSMTRADSDDDVTQGKACDDDEKAPNMDENHNLTINESPSPRPDLVGNYARSIYMALMSPVASTISYVEPEVLQKHHENFLAQTILRLCEAQTMTKSVREIIEQDVNDIFKKYREVNSYKASSHGPAIGIDLGTTFTYLATYAEGQARIIPNAEGSEKTPSCVSIQNQEVVVGSQAWSSKSDPLNTVFEMKRILGREYSDLHIQELKRFWPFEIINQGRTATIRTGEDQVLQAEEVTMHLVKYLKSCASEYLRQSVVHAVVTVPTYFTPKQKLLTKWLCLQAGLNVVSMVSEPAAAGLAHCIRNPSDRSRLCLTFDLGGGTLDVAVLEISRNKVKIRTIAGDPYLGGVDFDNEIIRYCLNKFHEEHGIHLLDVKAPQDRPLVARRLRRLKIQCEEQKCRLSVARSVTIAIDSIYDSFNLQVTLTRGVFEQLIEKYIQRCMNVVDEALMNSQLLHPDIDEVVLVGGSSRLPKIQQLLRTKFPQSSHAVRMIPEEAVASGAAILANFIQFPDTAHVTIEENQNFDIIF